MPELESAIIIEEAIPLLRVGPILHNGWFALDKEGRSSSAVLKDGFIVRRGIIGSIYAVASELGLFDPDVGHSYVNGAIWCLDHDISNGSFEGWAQTHPDEEVLARMKKVADKIYTEHGYEVN